MSKVLPTAAVCGGNSKTFVFYSGFWLKKRRFPDFILCKVHAQNNPSGPVFKHHWCGIIKVSLMMTAPCTGLMKVKDNRSFSRCLFFFFLHFSVDHPVVSGGVWLTKPMCHQLSVPYTAHTSRAPRRLQHLAVSSTSPPQVSNICPESREGLPSLRLH